MVASKNPYSYNISQSIRFAAPYIWTWIFWGITCLITKKGKACTMPDSWGQTWLEMLPRGSSSPTGKRKFTPLIGTEELVSICNEMPGFTNTPFSKFCIPKTAIRFERRLNQCKFRASILVCTWPSKWAWIVLLVIALLVEPMLIVGLMVFVVLVVCFHYE